MAKTTELRGLLMRLSESELLIVPAPTDIVFREAVADVMHDAEAGVDGVDGRLSGELDPDPWRARRLLVETHFPHPVRHHGERLLGDVSAVGAGEEPLGEHQIEAG